MDKETKKLIRTMGYLSTVGLAMALSIGIGALLGHYLDEKFGTARLIFGLVAAFRNLQRMYRRLKRENSD